jgi:hypothetical protein
VLKLLLAGVGCSVLAAEALDASGGIDQFLLAGEEGVAGGADFEDDVSLVGGAGLEVVAAGAADVGLLVPGVDGFLGHDVNPFVANPPQNGSLARAEDSTPGIDFPDALRAWGPTPGPSGAGLILAFCGDGGGTPPP